MRDSKTFVSAAALVAALVVAAAPALAQTGRIGGTVKSAQDNQPLKGATVTAENANGTDGAYTFGNRANVNFVQVESFEAGPGRRLAVSGLTDGTVSLFDPDPATGLYATTPAATLAPFGDTGGNVRAATGDVDGDGTPDSIVVTGPGTPIRFAVISGADNTTVLIPPTAPFAGSEDFTGGGFVAAANIDGQGGAEFAITPDQGGGPRVTIFSLVNGQVQVRANFFGIDDPAFRGGARAALGDVNRDGVADLAQTPVLGGGRRVGAVRPLEAWGASPG